MTSGEKPHSAPTFECSSTIRFIIACAACLFVVSQLYSISRGTKQVDFRTYYFAGKTYEEGINPYLVADLQKISGNQELELPFVYPPYTLPLVRLLSHLDYKTGYYLFLFLKLSFLAPLIFLWISLLRPYQVPWWVLLVVLTFGFRYAIVRDLRAGNVSIFEQYMLWLGLFLAIHRNLGVGVLFTYFAGFFKLLPALLTPLPLLIYGLQPSSTSRLLGVSLTCIALLTGLVALDMYVGNAELWKNFFASAGALEEFGNKAPSSRALFQEVSQFLTLPDGAGIALYLLWCVIVLSLLLQFIRRAKPSNIEHDSESCQRVLFASVLAYTILMPRMKDYSYIVALPSTLYCLLALTPQGIWRWVYLSFVCIPILPYQSLLTACIGFMQIVLTGRENKQIS